MPNEVMRSATLRSVLITLGLVALALVGLYLLRSFAAALLLIFAGILFGIFLNGLTNLAVAWLRLPRWAALTLICVLLLGAAGAFIWLAGPQVVGQMQQLAKQLPKSISALLDRLRRYDWGRALLGNMPSLGKMHWSIEALLGPVTQAFSITIEIIGWFVFVFFVGLYLAAAPSDYLDPALLVLAPTHRARGREVFHALGQGLGWWLFGRAVTMTSLGIVTALALWLFGIPLALVLGMIAGLLLFVPYIGAIAAAIPALLVALMESPAKALWVLVIYTAVHVFEGYFITPFVQRRAVALPPGLLLSVQILSASLFGLGGLVFSTPLTVVGIILVQMLYVQDVLGEKVAVLGDHHANEPAP
ncbi:MAG TPA: AI-2E family transporter [Chthoniobacterales bacterium]|jgi:predicted PurR-regulated permease PerM